MDEAGLLYVRSPPIGVGGQEGLKRMTGEPTALQPPSSRFVEVSRSIPMSGPARDCELAEMECPVSKLRVALAKAEALVRDHRLQETGREMVQLMIRRDDAAAVLARLTPRQYAVMEMVLVGSPSKNIAADLHISQRTVETHRAAIMKKTGAKCVPDLARFGLDASLKLS